MLANKANAISIRHKENATPPAKPPNLASFTSLVSAPNPVKNGPMFNAINVVYKTPEIHHADADFVTFNDFNASSAVASP